MARAWIDPAQQGWGPVRILAGQLRALGYRVDELRSPDGRGGAVSVLRLS